MSSASWSLGTRRWLGQTMTVPIATAALLQGCSDAAPLTEVAVTIDGDPKVMQQLTRVLAKVYRTDSPTQEQPASHAFALPAGAGSNPAPPRQPLTFGIQRGDADHFQLVVEGYLSSDPGEIPAIERKVLARFAPDERRALRVVLSAECLNLSNPCRTLERTCLPSARACAPIAEEQTTVYPPPLPAEPTAKMEENSCSAAVECSLPDYGCAPTTGTGYTCLGRFADWPMPDQTPTSMTVPRYDDASKPGIIRDVVTGLDWQRDLPAIYPGCMGSQPSLPSKGSTCSWDEAKVYCSQLSIGGQRFRLPSKIELESIVNVSLPDPPFDARYFPGKGSYIMYWTASPVFSMVRKESVAAWVVSWPGTTGFLETTRSAAVRCVSGIPSTASTPGQRYVMEPEGVIRDIRTGQSWTRQVSPVIERADDAKRHCEAHGGGFRLPTIKELLTLVDPARHDPAIDPVFLDTPSSPFWSSSVGGSEGALFVHFFNGMSYAENTMKAAPQVNLHGRRVRCVR
jgi:hypothetical protein